MRYMRNGKARTFYLAILFFIYRETFVFMDLSINTAMYGMFFILALAYYLLGCLNFNKNYYQFKDFVTSSILNFSVFLTFFLFSKKVEMILGFAIYDVLQNLIYAIFLKVLRTVNRVAILGCDEVKEKIEGILKSEEKYEYVGFITDKNIENTLGQPKDLLEIAKKNNIEKLIYTSREKGKLYAEEMLSLKLKGIEVIDYLGFLENIEGKIDVSKIDDLWILRTNGFDSLNNSFQKRIKKIFDFMMATIIFILALPFMTFTYIMVKLDVGMKYLILNPMKIIKNPAFFKQKRIGYQGKDFEIIKFRSMKIHDPSKFSKYASENDNRITKFGKFMRKVRLDELPQLINVFRGDMSFVGPRPEWNELGRDYEKKIKNYKTRYAVLPGLTGWAQVMYPYGASIDDAERKLEYDLYYIKHQDFIMDLVVFFKTIKIVLFGKGL